MIANEYGLLPASRLSIGSKICKELVGKLICDMANMREESVVTCSPEDDGRGGGRQGGIVRGETNGGIALSGMVDMKLAAMVV